MQELTVRSLKRCAILGAMLILAGCGVLDRDELFLRPAQYEERMVLQPVPVSRSWVSADHVSSVMQRPIYDGAEQRLRLRNATALPGDNLLILRARHHVPTQARLSFEEFTAWTGGLPVPFGDLKPGDLIQSQDEMGEYFYAEHRSGADTLCVFGIRRIDSSLREIPADGGVMDVQLRNCVRGSPAEALAPMMAASLSNGPAAQHPTGTSRLLSPLAGPGLH